MATQKILTILLASISVLASPFARAQDLDTIRIDNKQSILNDKAFFLFPTIAENVKRGVDIMSADPNANEETRIILDIGKMRLVFFAQELFTLAGNDLFETISKQNGDHFKTKNLSDKDSLQSVLSTPVLFDSTKNAILVNSLLVKAADNTLFRTEAYINPDAYKLKDQFQKLTEKVFSTLTKGTRKNNRSQRQEKLSIFGTTKSFTFNLPADYVITVDQQYDFQVFKFHKYQFLHDSDWVQVLIYAGYHPSLVYTDYGLKETDAQKIKGKFLNKNIDWLFFNVSKGGFFDKEQMIPSDDIGKGLIIHIAMLGNQQKYIDDVTKIIEAMRLN